MAGWQIKIVPKPSQEERTAILARLLDFNRSAARASDAQPLCVALVGSCGNIAGGLWGTTLYDWLVIEFLFVPEDLRGVGAGSELIETAEQEARTRACVGAWLDTFSFQARGFYEKLGYQLVGQINDHPLGEARYFLAKRWG